MLLPTGTQMQAIDRRAIDQMGVASLELMERAGAAVAAAVLELSREHKGPIVMLCGRGNNGGDGLVAARHIAVAGRDVQVWLTAEPDRFSPDAAVNWKRLEQEGSEATGTITVFNPGDMSPSVSALVEAWKQGAVIVDALLGTGTSGPPRAPLDSWIEAMNCCGRPILAVDIPSGVDADTGVVAGTAPLAHLTVTLGLPKCGLLLHPGRQHTGGVRVADIGLPHEAVEAEKIDVEVMTQDQAVVRLPPRAADAHKGDAGRLAVFAGSAGMMGAARLTCAAACRSGAGLVRHVAPESLLAIAQAGRDEVMVSTIRDGGTGRLIPGDTSAVQAVMAWADAVAFGPGLGTSPETLAFLMETLSLADPFLPGVFDADALNLMAQEPRLRSTWPGPMIMTPHPGEAARLLKQSTQPVAADRLGGARALAKRYQAVIVLKGAPTVVAHPDGELALCPLGNPGMATGGTGDVLTGIVAALLGQGLGPYTAACLGVYLHALAGDLAALDLGQWSLCAGDLVTYLPAAFGYLEAFPDRDVLAQGVWG